MDFRTKRAIGGWILLFGALITIAGALLHALWLGGVGLLVMVGGVLMGHREL